jgi:hypothetical protein
MNYGVVRVNIRDVQYESFSDMSFWQKFVPEGCELGNVVICHEPGWYDQQDMSWFIVNWGKK